MPLDSAGLLTSIRNLIDGTSGYPANPGAAGSNYAGAYGPYALTGTANAVIPTEGPGARAALAAGLGAAFSLGPGDPASVATAISLTLDLYWLAMLFAGQIVPPLTTGSAVFQVALLDILDGPNRDNPTAAAALRDALHTYTGLVQVTFVGPTTFFVL